MSLNNLTSVLKCKIAKLGLDKHNENSYGLKSCSVKTEDIDNLHLLLDLMEYHKNASYISCDFKAIKELI
jgi:hypothetical protein